MWYYLDAIEFLVDDRTSTYYIEVGKNYGNKIYFDTKDEIREAYKLVRDALKDSKITTPIHRIQNFKQIREITNLLDDKGISYTM